ncbi:MAG: prepilin peptidase [Desulfobacterales bacterium]|nr:prepilin peptidase [Desulfobacterales bacterium]
MMAETPFIYQGAVAFIYGLLIGSFLNVCIYRLPAGRSVHRPARSFCPVCGSGIMFYDNIPLLSYAWLNGRCRRCFSAISPRYPLVELLTGLCALGVVHRFGISLEAAAYFAFIAALIVVTFIDIDFRIIPDIISLPGIPLCFAASFAIPDVSVRDSLLGILMGGGSLYVIATAYNLVTGKDGMGGGDIKLLAMIGGLVGWKGVICTIFVSSASGCVIGFIIMLLKRKNLKLAIPYGPFLSLGAVIYIFFGPNLIAWYFGMPM